MSGPDEVFSWDGQGDWPPSSRRDHTLASALRNSVVWYFQRIAERLLQAFGAETRAFDPRDLPLPDAVPDTHTKVRELRKMAPWSEGQVWCSPERHGEMTGIMKAQIDPALNRRCEANAGQDLGGHAR